MKKIIIFILIIASIAIFFLNQNINDKKIGIIAPITGIVSSYGEDIKNGIISSNINTSAFVFEDDKCTPSEAVSAFSKLINFDKIHIIIGPACGSPQEAIIPILKQNDVVVIVPSAASDKLFEQSGGKFFNMQYSLEKEALFLSDKIYEKNKKVVVIGYQNAFSKTVTDHFVKNYKGEVVSVINFVDGKSDISTELIKLKNADFDAIVVTDISFFFAGGVKKLSQYEIKTPIYTEYVAELPAVRSLVEGVIYSYPDGVGDAPGAVFELSKEAVLLAKEANNKCDSNTNCIKNFLLSSGKFDKNGVSNRGLILKKIVDGNAVVL